MTFIGLSLDVEAGNWLWDDGSDVTYESWSFSQPDSSSMGQCFARVLACLLSLFCVSVTSYPCRVVSCVHSTM